VNPHVLPWISRVWHKNGVEDGLHSTLNYFCSIISLLLKRLLVLISFLPLAASVKAGMWKPQMYTGDITLLPHASLDDTMHVFGFQSGEILRQKARVARHFTWRKMSEIRHAMEVEKTLDHWVR
jgi:hypothetical protein